MKHYELSDELRNQLIETAAWCKAGIVVTEDKEVVSEKKQKDKAEPKAKEEPKEEVQEEELDEEAQLDEFVEAVVHTCPLCYSHLNEALEEDRILEHLDTAIEIAEKLSQINEDESNSDEIVQDCIAELFLSNIDFEEDEETEE